MSRERMISAAETEVRRRTECIKRLWTVEADVLAKAMEVFESPDGAAEWLVSPTSTWAGLEGKAPIDVAATAQGREQVLQLLGRIEHGIPP
jgi:putative toxin-antitoxin system antitoxin component (TIGR02293 family)